LVPGQGTAEDAMKRSSLSFWGAMVSMVGMMAVSPARAEDAVLVASTVDRYVPGTVIAEGQILDVPAGASATLLFRSGHLLRLKGPFEGSLREVQPADAPGGVEGLVEALRRQGVDATVVGATRGLAPPPSARSAMKGQPVLADIRRSAIYCLGAGDTLWLHGRADTGLLRLRRGHSVREMAWPAGVTRVAWPDDLLIEDGDRFDVVDEHGAALATMIFHRLDPAPSALAWIAAGLLSGCRSQIEPALRELVAAVEKNSDP